MKIKIDQTDFIGLYAEAEKSFKDSLANNDYLKSEIDIPLEEIQVKENYVRMQFFVFDNNQSILETNLLLLSPNGEEIGWYCLHKDENGEVVDDYLYFE